MSEDEDEEDEEDYKYNNNFVDSSKDDRNYYGTTNNNKHNSQRPSSKSRNKPSMPEKSKGFWNWEDKGNISHLFKKEIRLRKNNNSLQEIRLKNPSSSQA